MASRVVSVVDPQVLNEILSRPSGKVIIKFKASWCSPCKKIAPVFADLSTRYPNIIFLEVDVEEAQAISDAYSVDVMPTFVFIYIQDSNPYELKRFTGGDVSELKNWTAALSSH